MAIRLNKVTRDLNVGITTVVEFLQKKGHTIEASPNAKITEEQYAELVKEFSKDKNLKKESEKFIQERQNKDRNKPTVSIEEEPKKEENKKAEPKKEEAFQINLKVDKDVTREDVDMVKDHLRSSFSVVPIVLDDDRVKLLILIDFIKFNKFYYSYNSPAFEFPLIEFIFGKKDYNKWSIYNLFVN